MTQDTDGVDMRLFCPTQTRLTPLAAAIFVMIYNKQLKCHFYPKMNCGLNQYLELSSAKHKEHDMIGQ
jgi:hypothetical protein